MTNYKLQLNRDKTEMMFIAPNKSLCSDSVPSTIMFDDGTAIQVSDTVRNLGVVLDKSLSFEQQVSAICRMCYLELRRISSIRHLLSVEATKTLICSFVLSRLDYCNSLLAGCPKHLLQKLQRIQNNAARLIFRTSRSSHVTPLFISLHWLPVERRVQYKIALLCFKSLNGLAPAYLSDLIHIYIPSRQLRSSADTRVFRIPSFRTKTFGQRAFSYQAPIIWNQLPYHVRHSPNLSAFKSSLKTHLFQASFPSH